MGKTWKVQWCAPLRVGKVSKCCDSVGDGGDRDMLGFTLQGYICNRRAGDAEEVKGEESYARAMFIAP